MSDGSPYLPHGLRCTSHLLGVGQPVEPALAEQPDQALALSEPRVVNQPGRVGGLREVLAGQDEPHHCRRDLEAARGTRSQKNNEAGRERLLRRQETWTPKRCWCVCGGAGGVCVVVVVGWEGEGGREGGTWKEQEKPRWCAAPSYTETAQTSKCEPPASGLKRPDSMPKARAGASRPAGSSRTAASAASARFLAPWTVCCSVSGCSEILEATAYGRQAMEGR